MRYNLSYTDARDIVTGAVRPVQAENVPLDACYGRILAETVTAAENIPPFDRSPYDGYAYRAEDSAGASTESPVTLKILEEVPAGGIWHYPVTKGTCTKILTGAPIPEGADAVVMFEKTEFTATEIKIFAEAKPGDNIVVTGEDVKIGDVLAEAGTVIDAGTLGTLASQNISAPLVYKVPKVGIISTGSELTPVGEELLPGKIYDSNTYSIGAAVRNCGCESILFGIAGDDTDTICAALEKALSQCDAVITTGGVSVGDYDFTPAAIEKAGCTIMFRHAAIKPGMACAYASDGQKLVCALSGNPASSITNFYAIAAPALKKLSGLSSYLPQELPVVLKNGFNKKSPCDRLLRGIADLSDGCVKMSVPKDQGNVVLSSTIGCNIMALIPAGSGKIPEGTVLKGFFI